MHGSRQQVYYDLHDRRNRVVDLTADEKARFSAWCEQEFAVYQAQAETAGRCGTQVANLVAQGTGLKAASLQVVSVLLGGDPVPAVAEVPAEQPDTPAPDA